MKQIFDWLREQIREIEITIDFRIKELLKKDNAADFEKLSTKQMTLLEVMSLINEAEAKWEADCCEWFKYNFRTIAPRNHDVENPYWRIPENMDKLKFCPYCGKPIKISEVE